AAAVADQEAVAAVEGAGDVGPVPFRSTKFWAMMVLRRRAVAPCERKTPPPVWALLSVTVALSKVRLPVSSTPPPLPPAELPMTVLLVRFTAAAIMPPPAPRVVLPLTVLLVSASVVALMPPPLEPAVLPLTVLLVSVAVSAAMAPPAPMMP